MWELITLKTSVLAVHLNILSELHEQCQAGLENSRFTARFERLQDKKNFRHILSVYALLSLAFS